MSNYYLGIDVSKGYADFTLLDSNKKIVESNFQLDDTFIGHQKLFGFLQSFFCGHNDATVFTAVESTGGYENNWYNSLRKFQEILNLKVTRLNPKGVNHHSKAGMNRIITDRLAAKNIAEYLISHPEKVSYQTQDYYYPIRRKWMFIKSLTKEKTKFLNQLENLLYEANPDILIFCKDKVSRWILLLLQKFPTAKSLASASVDQIAKIPYISKERAQTLIERAKISIASANDFLTQDTIQNIAGEIIRLEKLINSQVQIIVKNCDFNELELLKSFRAIGDFSAIGLLIEIGAVERFPTIKHLASFFGLHPVFKISGDGIRGVRMSKEGRKEPRAILFMVALTAICQNPLIKEVYNRNLQKGKCKMDAIGVCMHKILRIVYGMLKNNQPFDPEIDRRNQENNFRHKNEAQMNTTRRLQKPDNDAPISRRQNKKRKEQEMSQNGKTVKHEINLQTLSPN